MDRAELQRKALRLPLLRRLSVRRWLWARRNDLGRMRRRLFELLGSDRYSHPALHGLDRRLAELLPRHGGYFVEAGAYDGFIQSNTYWLERFRGWRGVLVEPVPHLYRSAVRERSGASVFNCALVPEGHPESSVTLRYGGLMSTVDGAKGGGEEELAHVRAGDMHGLDDVAYEVTAEARTLTSVLVEAGAPREIDLLSLDVEGFEVHVLRGLDLDRFRPRVLVVEMHDVEALRPAVEAVLGERYELLEQPTPLDVIYVRRAPDTPAQPADYRAADG